jgi:hypothetical protein
MVSGYLLLKSIVNLLQDILTPALNRRRLKLTMSDSETEDEVGHCHVIVVVVNLFASRSMLAQP